MAIAPDDALRLDEAAEAMENGWTIPARWYSDPDVYKLECERIFNRNWTLLCPEAKLAAAGDHVIGNAGQVPVIVTRDADGALHGFVNICRHRAHPVALKDGCRKLLQCRYHGWTYSLDGRLQNAPRATREMQFDRDELSLIPVAVDTWRGFVFVNPDATAAPLLDVHPGLEPLASEHELGFTDWNFRGRWSYDIPANWKVWVENATECYHCPTVHTKSFSDAFVTDANVYELVESGGLLCQFTPYNDRRAKTRWGGQTGEGFRFIYMWPTSFWAQDDQVAFTGMIVPTGVETCTFQADVYAHPKADEAFIVDWMEMYNQTLAEDVDVVRVQQPGLRSQMVPYGRLLPKSESPIRHFHQLVYDALAADSQSA
jgi:phenylpropionate dioxygenase-like ring-hydroxylating dioxygenase large terminal subunit